MAYQEIDINNMFRVKLLRSLAMPSSIHTYSLCIEYMKKWFLSKFEKNTFKHVHVEGKHAFDDFRTMNKTEMLKRIKPVLSIIPQIDLEFDDEKLDSYPYGGEIYTMRSKLGDTFYRNRSKDLYIGMSAELHLINFTFKCKYSTKAQQMDAYRYMKLFFRVGYTQGEDVSMDFHVPYGLMLQLAHDEGFEVKDNKIQDVVGFLSHINQQSLLPFMYKFRCINGTDEFFIRLDELYVHIRTTDISADEGERVGQLMDNYTIELNAQVRFPAPKFYVYYSAKDHTYIKFKKEAESIPAFEVQMLDLPKVNEKGWNQFLTTEYQEEELDKPLEIDFSELFNSGDLGEVIKYNNSIHISSDVCIELRLFNNGKPLDFEMDWNTMILKCPNNPENIITNIAIYVDLDYTNNTLINLRQLKENRIN